MRSNIFTIPCSNKLVILVVSDICYISDIRNTLNLHFHCVLILLILGLLQNLQNEITCKMDWFLHHTILLLSEWTVCETVFSVFVFCLQAQELRHANQICCHERPMYPEIVELKHFMDKDKVQYREKWQCVNNYVCEIDTSYCSMWILYFWFCGFICFVLIGKYGCLTPVLCGRPFLFSKNFVVQWLNGLVNNLWLNFIFRSYSLLFADFWDCSCHYNIQIAKWVSNMWCNQAKWVVTRKY